MSGPAVAECLSRRLEHGFCSTMTEQIMAAYLCDEVDMLVTSNTQDFPHDDCETVVTPRGFLDQFAPLGDG